MLALYLILIVSLVNATEDLPTTANHDCIIDLKSEQCINILETTSNNFSCYQKLFLEQLITEFQNGTTNEVGYIVYSFNSTGHSISYKRQFSSNNTSLINDAKVEASNITSNMAALQESYNALNAEVKLFKTLLESASRSLKTVKKQLKHQAKLNEVKKEDSEEKKKESDEDKNSSSSEEEKVEKKHKKNKDKKEKKEKNKKHGKEEEEDDRKRK